MRITVHLDEALFESAKLEAARRGTTLTALIESGLRLTLSQSRQDRLPVCQAVGGTLPESTLMTAVHSWIGSRNEVDAVRRSRESSPNLACY